MTAPSIPLDAVRVPLYCKDGSIRAYTLVSQSDAEGVNRWKWFLCDYGYAGRRERRQGRLVLISLHRFLLGLEFGDDRQGDHLNRDRLDNRRSNLRVLPKGANQQNRPSYRGSSSRFRGVSWHKHKQQWIAAVEFGGKRTHLGYFTDENEAGRVAREARLRELPYAVD